MSFLIYFFPFVFKFLFFKLLFMNLKFLETATEIVFLIIMVPVKRDHFVRNSVNQGPATLLEISSFINISMGTVT